MSSPPSRAPRGGRGRRRVAPRQVRRRRTAPTSVAPAPAPAPRPARARAARTRGAPRPVYAPDVVGLGQVAPPKHGVSRAAAQTATLASSRKSSAMSSVGAGAFGEQGTAGSSTGSLAGWMGAFSANAGWIKSEGDGDCHEVFKQYFEVDEESDDEHAKGRNSEIGECAGTMGNRGTLLPVSLTGLRETEQQQEEKGKRETFALGDLTDVRNASRLMLVQMPGLLAVPGIGNKERENERIMSSVQVAEEAARRIRQVGTDLTKIGEKGALTKIGRVRFYKSGKIEFVMEYGDVLQLNKGIHSTICQQAVIINNTNTTCHELQNVIDIRLVATPLFQ